MSDGDASHDARDENYTKGITLRITGTISVTFASGPVGRVIRVVRAPAGVSTPVGRYVERPVYTGCICLLHPWVARANGCPEHGLQPLTDHTENLKSAYKRGDLAKILPRMTADEVAVAERGLPEKMREAVRLAWRELR